MYDLKAEDSTWGMLVRVTGGMSLVDGAFGVIGPVVCGKSPVRTMGGWIKVAIATESLLSTSM